MGGKSGAKQEVIDYLMSIHYSLCHGPVDAITHIKIGDKEIGVGEITSNTAINVDNEDLFGGPKKGGGIKGRLHFLFGEPNQTLSEFLAAKMGRTPTTMTGYRGLTSVFFTGYVNGRSGFKWGTNNPYIPKVSFRARRAPKALDENALIGPDANPAHIIAECLINDVWGAGYLPEEVNEESFQYAAQIFRDEGLGLSMRWNGTRPVEDFINDVLRHVNANLGFDFVKNHWVLTPLRGDYIVDDLVQYGPRESSLANFQRRAWGDTINQVTVTWRNPENEEDETVVVQDLAGFAIQRRSVADVSGDYKGARTRELALKLAERDLRQASAPLSSVEIEVAASKLKSRVGDPVVFEWFEPHSDFRIKPTVMRVVKVEMGSRGAAFRKVYLIEDIYSFGVSPVSAAVTQTQPTSQTPVNPSAVRISAPPYFVVANALGDSEAEDMQFPSTGLFILADTGLRDVRDIDVFSELAQPEQGLAYEDVGTVSQPGTFVLQDDLVPQFQTTVNIPEDYDRSELAPGAFALIAAGGVEEIWAVTSVGADSFTVKRGVLDTVLRPWTAGTLVWVFSRTFNGYDRTERAVGETARHKLLPVTSAGRLPLSQANEVATQVDDRAYLPLRPANVRVNNFPYDVFAPVGDLNLSWATRNRLTETSQILSWDAGSVPPESGQLTRIRVTKNSVEELNQTVSGDSTTLNTVALGATVGEVLNIEFSSTRNGFESFDRTTIAVTIV